MLGYLVINVIIQQNCIVFNLTNNIGSNISIVISFRINLKSIYIYIFVFSVTEGNELTMSFLDERNNLKKGRL